MLYKYSICLTLRKILKYKTIQTMSQLCQQKNNKHLKKSLQVELMIWRNSTKLYFPKSFNYTKIIKNKNKYNDYILTSSVSLTVF